MVTTEIRFLIDRHLEIARLTDSEKVKRENISAASELLEMMKSQNREQYDTSVKTFIGTMCHKTENRRLKTKPKVLYFKYKTWCDQTGQEPIDRLCFYNHLYDMGFRKKGYNGNYYFDICVKETDND